jgi:hypothetical protein
LENAMKKRLLLSTLLVFLGALVTTLLLQAQGMAQPGAQIKFISGGIGEDSAAQMAAAGREYNLKLLFAAKDGHYLADVAVTISDTRGGKLLEAVSTGPFLYAQLAPGKYRITASYAGVASARDTTIAASGRRELVFRWEEPGLPD